jgi:light-regulated signal transduction histidine kinase (bacteriophytochrome)
MTILTEPIGSIPRPLQLIEALHTRDGADPALEPLYEAVIRDTLARFGATGSPVITDGEPVLRRALDHLRPALAASGAAVSHSALPTLHAVPSQLQLLLQELIDNVLKFHGSAPPRVHLWAEREARG